MHYLKDYLELIEHLPLELRDRLTEVRELDLQVNNAMDNLKDRIHTFFPIAEILEPGEKEVEYEKIRQELYKALEDADEKVKIANQMHDLGERYLRRLDQELEKFKLELEADCAGSTETLEKRFRELYNPSPTTKSIASHHPKRGRGKKRKYRQQNSFVSRNPEKQVGIKNVFISAAIEAMRETIEGNRVNSNAESPSGSSTSSTTSTGSDQDGAVSLTPQTKAAFEGKDAIATAASQAIAATQLSLKRVSGSQSSSAPQGLLTGNLKASDEAVNSDQNLEEELSLGNREMNSTSAANTTTDPANESVKSKTKVARRACTFRTGLPAELLRDFIDSSLIDDNLASDGNDDLNEPRYCVCNRISFGDMVACDHRGCPFEWFHYQCVGITQPPRGRWFCPQCSASAKRRSRKEK